MSSELGSVSVWIRMLPENSPAAQEALYTRFREELLRYASYRLRVIGVQGTGADDIAQEVFLNLFNRAADGKLPELKHRGDFWKKLRLLCFTHVINARRKDARFTKLFRSFPGVAGENGDSSNGHGLEQVQDEHLVEIFAAIEHEILLKRLERRHGDLPKIAELRYLGYSVQQIATELGMAKRTIERRLEWIEKECEKYQAND